MKGEKLSSIYVANMDTIYWLISFSIRRGGDWVKGVIASYNFLFLKVEIEHLKIYIFVLLRLGK